MADRELQRLINRSVKAHNAALDAANELNDYCIVRWNITPSDLDADNIIDACFGGCGMSDGMKAADFERTMQQLTGTTIT